MIAIEETRGRSVSKPKTDLRMAVRRSRLKLLIDLAHTREQMAQELKCSIPTIDRDLVALRADPEFKISGPAAEEALQKLMISNSVVKDQLWAIASAKDTPAKTKVVALSGIARLNERIGRLMAMYGLMPAVGTVRVETSLWTFRASLMDLIRDVPEDVQHRFLDALEQTCVRCRAVSEQGEIDDKDDDQDDDH